VYLVTRYECLVTNAVCKLVCLVNCEVRCVIAFDFVCVRVACFESKPACAVVCWVQCDVMAFICVCVRVACLESEPACAVVCWVQCDVSRVGEARNQTVCWHAVSAMCAVSLVASCGLSELRLCPWLLCSHGVLWYML